MFYKAYLFSFISLDEENLIADDLFLAGSAPRTLKRGKKYDEFIGM